MDEREISFFCDRVRATLAGMPPQHAAMGRDSVKNRKQPIDENVSERLPQTVDEIEPLKPAIAELLRTIPET